jgi:hypothetical protein
MSKIAVFYHAWGGGASHIIVPEQLKRLKASGLYDEADYLFAYTSGESRIPDQPDTDKLLTTWNKEETWELRTLSELHTWAKDNQDTYILYMHTKGASRYYNCTNDWRLLMEYYTIDNYKTCIKLLDAGADMVGVNLHPGPVPHYSGNFWWAKANYISSLPPISFESKNGNPARMNAEFWPVSGTGIFECLHYSKCDHYIKRYPPGLYGIRAIREDYLQSKEIRNSIWAEQQLPPISDLPDISANL